MANNQEWYTPQWVISLVLEVLGRIDLDPFANAYGTVPAIRSYIGSRGEDGYSLPWGEMEYGVRDGRTYAEWRAPFCVFANPPWNDPMAAIEKAKLEHKAGRFTELILLLPARTGTKWFHAMHGFPLCLPKGRIKYQQMNDAGQLYTPGNGGKEDSCLFYLGHRPQQFADVFGRIGLVYMPSAIAA